MSSENTAATVDRMVEIRWHARGGQGAKTAAMFLAEAVLDIGMFGQGFPEYGPERRGAPMRGFTRISGEPIRRHCMIERPGFVVVLDPTLLDSPAAGVTAGTDKDTVFVINTSESPATIREKLGVKGATVHTVDAMGIALDTIGRPIPNMPMIGALLAVKDVMSVDDLKNALVNRLSSKFSQAIIDGNLAAVDRAFKELVSE
ncbi:pyruvate synthase [bacterium]|nr:pyruvate synthase [bacterium]PIV81039.1 MAG: pyruvate synthase [bacterium CG17_big_fil_post_rev_8_21_14_2_50_64_8]PJA75052.1 MAG: pyruvate synthase [bacterium CG_4_9_14_3_um_filter_65_15]